MVAISYDSVEVLERFSEQRGIGYSLLSDPGSKTIEAYGVLKEGGKGIPHPTIFLIDDENVIRDKLRYEGFRKRHKGENVIEAVRRLRGIGDDGTRSKVE